MIFLLKINYLQTVHRITCQSLNKAGHIRPDCPELKHKYKGNDSVRVIFVFESDLPSQKFIAGKGYLFIKPVIVRFDNSCSFIVKNNEVYISRTDNVRETIRTRGS